MAKISFTITHFFSLTLSIFGEHGVSNCQIHATIKEVQYKRSNTSTFLCNKVLINLLSITMH